MPQYNTSLYDTKIRNHTIELMYIRLEIKVLRHRILELIYKIPADIFEKTNTHSMTAFSNHVKHHILELYSYGCMESHCYACNNIAP